MKLATDGWAWAFPFEGPRSAFTFLLGEQDEISESFPQRVHCRCGGCREPVGLHAADQRRGDLLQHRCDAEQNGSGDHVYTDHGDFAVQDQPDFRLHR